MRATALAPAPESRGSERRVHARAPYAGVLHLQCARESTWFSVYGQDVSVGGFAFYSDVALRRGERLNVCFAELETLALSATVRHVAPDRQGFVVGVEFDELLPPELARCLG